MSGAGVPDVLGPQVLLLNGVSYTLRGTLQFHFGPDLHDDPLHSRSRLVVPDPGILGYQTVTVPASVLSAGGELVASAPQLSTADLVRIDCSEGDRVVIGMADVVHAGGGVDYVQAVPDKPIKYVCNVGGYNLTLRPPAAQPTDPDAAGIFIDNITLKLNDCVRVFWDPASYGYRIQGGGHAYLVYEGQYVVHEGKRIYIRV